MLWMNQSQDLFFEFDQNSTKIFSPPIQAIDNLIYGMFAIEKRQESIPGDFQVSADLSFQ